MKFYLAAITLLTTAVTVMASPVESAQTPGKCEGSGCVLNNGQIVMCDYGSCKGHDGEACNSGSGNYCPGA
ncbi:uncharacterized protein BDW47DRAFT_125694 [Aspergillus candidus]|uniref:EGF-like domain-containing protein n=1 Tax=Aspergillus candidus TaxID=41067 RepID=A0A2I2FBI3_ASPCN|nr:hypothetical protein BDW47DRAFT_125694 [Aspergillus candidus]PLB37989.1 hypothetical protein BDW47DRAFT_125694 [Aspergillus candidus]